MDLVSLKLWQWMLIGTLAGTAVGYAWSNLPNDLERTGDKNQFSRLVRQSAAAKARNQPAPIRNIVVLEPELDPSNVLVYPVKFEYTQPARRANLQQALADAAKNKGKAPAAAAADAPEYTPSGIYAVTPFDGTDSVIEFLKKRDVPFADRTGGARFMPIYYGAGGGFLAIGVVWPGLIQALIKGGLVKPPPPKEKKEKKHRTGEDVDDMLTQPTAKPVDAGALGRLNDEMEANLAGSLSSGGVRGPNGEIQEPVSVLMNGTGSRSAPDPTEPRAPMTEQEKKDFAGQYYPVARVVKKKDE